MNRNGKFILSWGISLFSFLAPNVLNRTAFGRHLTHLIHQHDPTIESGHSMGLHCVLLPCLSGLRDPAQQFHCIKLLRSFHATELRLQLASSVVCVLLHRLEPANDQLIYISVNQQVEQVAEQFRLLLLFNRQFSCLPCRGMPRGQWFSLPSFFFFVYICANVQ